MKRMIIILMMVSLLTISGCYSGSYITEAQSYSECAVKCNAYADKYSCHQYIPSYTDTTINGLKQITDCDCFVTDCFKEPQQTQPKE